MRRESSPPLPVFHDHIEARVRDVREQHAWWPCQRGCDGCCRNLGELPHATIAEWGRVGAAIDELSASTRAEVAARMGALAAHPETRPIICPMLDREAGACSIYDARPLACRTYGYYVSRGEGRWCGLIENELAARPEEAEGITFGNLDAFEAEVRACHGDTISLLTWWSSRTRDPLRGEVR